MSNTKMWQFALFTGQSSYFNYDEFIKELIEATESNDIPVSESIKWKAGSSIRLYLLR